nr:hypothetical protein BaRGS_024440 [Batillaria attramentaria]
MSAEEEQQLYLPTVKKTIAIITRHFEAAMSAVGQTGMLGANFWCYHKKHRERYLRKRDEKRVKEGLHERRRITALMRSHFQNHFVSKSVDSHMESDDFVDPRTEVTEITEVTEVSCSVDAVTSPILDQWTSQNGFKFVIRELTA